MNEYIKKLEDTNLALETELTDLKEKFGRVVTNLETAKTKMLKDEVERLEMYLKTQAAINEEYTRKIEQENADHIKQFDIFKEAQRIANHINEGLEKRLKFTEKELEDVKHQYSVVCELDLHNRLKIEDLQKMIGHRHIELYEKATLKNIE